MERIAQQLTGVTLISALCIFTACQDRSPRSQLPANDCMAFFTNQAIRSFYQGYYEGHFGDMVALPESLVQFAKDSPHCVDTMIECLRSDDKFTRVAAYDILALMTGKKAESRDDYWYSGLGSLWRRNRGLKEWDRWWKLAADDPSQKGSHNYTNVPHVSPEEANQQGTKKTDAL